MLLLRSSDASTSLEVSNKERSVLGRGTLPTITSTKVSRQHCSLQAVLNTTTGQPALQVQALKRVFIQRAGSAEYETVHPGTSLQLHEGDHLCLLRDVKPRGGFDFQYAFVVEQASQAHTPPTKKRRTSNEQAQLATQCSVQHQLLASPVSSASWDSLDARSPGARRLPSALAAASPRTPDASRTTSKSHEPHAGSQQSPPSVAQRAKPALADDQAAAHQSHAHGHDHDQHSPSQALAPHDVAPEQPDITPQGVKGAATTAAGDGGASSDLVQLHAGNSALAPPAGAAVALPASAPDREASALPSKAAEQPRPPQPGQLLGRCHIVFWVSKHVSRLRSIAADHGAVVEQALGIATTHVIANRDTSPQFAQARLAQMPARKCRPILFHGQRLELPVGVNFVVPEWLSECVAKGKIFTSNQFQIDMQRIAISDGIRLKDTQDPSSVSPRNKYKETVPDKSASVAGGACAQLNSTNSGEKPRGAAEGDEAPAEADQLPTAAHAASQAQQHPAAGAAAGSKSSGQKSSPVGSTTQAKATAAPVHTASQAYKAGAAPTAARPANPEPGTALPAALPVPQTLQEQKEMERQSVLDAEQGRMPRFTGGTSGVEWGLMGCWEEPWHVAGARDTLNKLERYWFRRSDAKEPSQGEMEADDSGDLGNSTTQRSSVAPINQVCTHVACSLQRICLIEELETIKKNYRGPEAQYKKKAMDRAISEVTAQNKPFVYGSDVDAMPLGDSTKEKLRVLINRGEYEASTRLANDERRKALDQFMEVWGAAEATSERWYADGCRTLDDVRKRSDLTEQQTVGLKYYDDLEQPIPRTEAAAVERLVYMTACEVLRCDPEASSDRIHCRATGSYLRGKPATGDVDFLIMPPASAGEVPPGPFLTQLLAALLRKGLLLNELNPTKPRSVHDRSATWLGLCKPAGSPFVRRIDIKVYTRRAIAYAVNYFTGSGSFVRALRFWSATSPECATRAAAVVPAANGFKLNDVALVPTFKSRDRKAADPETIVGTNVECTTETDIFAQLGLAYVPPNMRMFGSKYE